jgi:hypothetical protein
LASRNPLILINETRFFTPFLLGKEGGKRVAAVYTY